MKKLLMATLAFLTIGAVAPSMAAGDASAGKGKSAVCAACHGADGNSPTDMFPKIAGQGEAYLVKQLIEFKSGVRSNAVMAPMVAALTEQDMADLAAYYAGQNIAPAATSEDLVAAVQPFIALVIKNLVFLRVWHVMVQRVPVYLLRSGQHYQVNMRPILKLN